MPLFGPPGPPGPPGPRGSSGVAGTAAPGSDPAWLPSEYSAKYENLPRWAATAEHTLTDGQLVLVGGLVVPEGASIASISFYCVTQPADPTHQWFCLVRKSDLAVLRKTADALTQGWTANTFRTLSLTTPWVATEDTPVYAGIVVTTTTSTPGLLGVAADVLLNTGANPPALFGHSNSGLTTPGSLGATADAPLGGLTVYYYATLN